MPTLATEELFQFDLQGYFILEQAIDAARIGTLTARLRELEQLEPRDLPPHAFGHWTPGVNEYRILNLGECGEPFLPLIDEQPILDRVECLVPAPFRLTEFYSITRLRGMGIPLHYTTTGSYSFKGDGARTTHLAVAICLTDCGPEDGPLVVFAGSHKLGPRFPYGPWHPHWARPDHDVAWVNEFEAGLPPGAIHKPWEQIPGYTELHVRAGDLIFFTEDLWHGAAEHRSDRVRRILYLSYSPAWFTNWHGTSHSAELKSRATPRQRQLLAGPYVGNRLEGHDTPELEGHPSFPFMPQSEHAARNRGLLAAEAADADAGDEVREIFERLLVERLAERPHVAELGAVVQLWLHGAGGGPWVLDLTSPGGAVRSGRSDCASCFLALEARDFVAMFHGRAEPVELFYRGRLEVRGDVSVAMRLADLWGS